MLRRIGVIACIPFIGVMNYLSQNQYFGEKQIQDLTEIPGAIATPSGWAFSIWGVIYLGILAYCIYQIISKRKNEKKIHQITPRVLTNLIANGLRYSVATIQGYIWASAILIVIMWISLGFIVRYLTDYEKDRIDRLCVTIPMSLYFGWITIATPLNIAAALSDLGYTRAITNPVAVLSWIAIAWVTSVVVFWKTHRISYIVITLWALIAVMTARVQDSPIIFWVAVGLVGCTLGVILYKGYKKNLVI